MKPGILESMNQLDGGDHVLLATVLGRSGFAAGRETHLDPNPTGEHPKHSQPHVCCNHVGVMARRVMKS